MSNDLLFVVVLSARWLAHRKLGPLGLELKGLGAVAQFLCLELEVCGLAVEDGMPLAIIKRELNFIMEKKKMDQGMFRIAVLASADTESGELYHSGFQMWSAVYAKDRRTRKLYNDLCEIP